MFVIALAIIQWDEQKKTNTAEQTNEKVITNSNRVDVMSRKWRKRLHPWRSVFYTTLYSPPASSPPFSCPLGADLFLRASRRSWLLLGGPQLRGALRLREPGGRGLLRVQGWLPPAAGRQRLLWRCGVSLSGRPWLVTPVHTHTHTPASTLSRYVIEGFFFNRKAEKHVRHNEII